MTRPGESEAARRRRVLDEWERDDNRVIAYILIGVLVIVIGGLGVLVVLDVTDDGEPTTSWSAP